VLTSNFRISPVLRSHLFYVTGPSIAVPQRLLPGFGLRDRAVWVLPDGLEHDAQVQQRTLKLMGLQRKGALIEGETDGSSYPNVGLRGTSTPSVDTSPSYLFHTIVATPFIPFRLGDLPWCCPRRRRRPRANAAIDKHGSRLLKHLGLGTSVIGNWSGLGDFPYSPRTTVLPSSDLQLTGVIGRNASRTKCAIFWLPSQRLLVGCMRRFRTVLASGRSAQRRVIVSTPTSSGSLLSGNTTPD
jgi:hypothetical protein